MKNELHYIALHITRQHTFFNYLSHNTRAIRLYEGWHFNSGNYLFTTDTK